MTANELHAKFSDLVKTERKITQEVLYCIQQIDGSKAFAELGYSSLFDYLVRGQKYSEGSAQRRISAARLLKEIPAIESKVQEGTINLTQLVKLSVAVKQELKTTGKKLSAAEKESLVNRLEGKNSHETDTLLGRELNYSSLPPEKIVSRQDDYFLTLKMTPLQLEKLHRAQSILSHSCHDGNMADLIENLCDKVIQQKDGKTATAATAVVVTVKPGRAYLAEGTRRFLFQRAHHCCEYVSASNGIRCISKYQLQIDHIVPIAKGGANDPSNLRVLCRTHNLAEARRWGL